MLATRWGWGGLLQRLPPLSSAQVSFAQCGPLLVWLLSRVTMTPGGQTCPHVTGGSAKPPHLVPVLGDLLQAILPVSSQMRGESRDPSTRVGDAAVGGMGMPSQGSWPCSAVLVNTSKPVCLPQECVLKSVAAPRNSGDLPLPLS